MVTKYVYTMKVGLGVEAWFGVRAKQEESKRERDFGRRSAIKNKVPVRQRNVWLLKFNGAGQVQ